MCRHCRHFNYDFFLQKPRGHVRLKWLQSLTIARMSHPLTLVTLTEPPLWVKLRMKMTVLNTVTKGGKGDMGRGELMLQGQKDILCR